MTSLIHFTPRQTTALAGARSSGFTVRFISSAAERSQCFALRLKAYDAFVDPAAMRVPGEFSDAFDDLPTTVQIGVFDGERLVGTMRLCFSCEGDLLAALPCAAHYPALKAMKAAAPHAGFMEVSRVAIDPGITNTSYRTTLYASLVRVGLLAAEAAGVTSILIATRAEWVRFYKYMLGFSQIGEPAFYPPGDFKITLLGGDMTTVRARQRMQNAFFQIAGDEIASMRRALSDVLDVREVA